ncbi:SulP family inorganic anion transporter [Hymenobacter sp. 15J16-1T3B]|uniref:SulP family inorganic anion transporter n=1 Tax=Hymenobacter sp. 15J16-1T3B TaxID=2886941 RepID=UPI001D0FCBCE|nr:SulP family inorganic anion transporter [Hymenobacter sp. 15J16-1T3B]MCC3159051.1 SulP family inorganic anion transporter [Hymenobacter sp. 15J16-1T3B]
MEVPTPAVSAGGPAAGLRQQLGPDVRAGFLVFLIALPLGLAISKASGFPPVAGILTAIIGGMVVTLVGGPGLTIKGPAAGLIVVAAGAVQELGRGDALLGYRLTLAVVVAAGVLQILFGLLRAGALADFFPSAAMYGMMASIGLTVSLKQLFVITGTSPVAQEPLRLLGEVPGAFAHLNPGVFCIGMVSLALLFGLPLLRQPLVRKIPVQLLVLLVSVPLGRYFGLGHAHTYLFLARHHYSLGPEFLVSLPTSLSQAVTLPDFTQIFSGVSLKYIGLFALVGSLESLLSAQAVDLLAPTGRRKADLNRDLLGVGVGNVLAGLVGGLPMIAEIVRSSANVAAGARTRWANFFHGLFLLGFVAVGSQLLTQIPLAALGALLLHIGFRLAGPRQFARMFRIGGEQLLIFLTTIAVTLATDLLVGIGAGIVSKLLIHLLRGLPLRSVFTVRTELLDLPDGGYLVKVRDAAVFSNYLSLKTQLAPLPKGKHVVLDLSDTRLVDHTVLEHLERFRADYLRDGGQLEITGLQRHLPVSGYPTAARVRAEAVNLASA